MDIKDYAQMMGYLTRPRDVVPDPSTMDQEPRMGYYKGESVVKSHGQKIIKLGEAGESSVSIAKKLDLKQQTVNNAINAIEKGLAGNDYKFSKPFKEILKLSVNETGVNLKDPKYLEEVIQFIDDNPTLNQKEGMKFLGKKRAILVPAESWGNPGKKWDDEKAKLRNKKKKQWTDKYSKSDLQGRLTGEEGVDYHHAGAKREPVSTANTMYLDSKINRKTIQPFERALTKIQDQQYKTNLNRNMPIEEKRKIFKDLTEQENALRKKYPDVSDFKSSLVFEESALSPTGYMKKEVMPNESLTISEGKTGQKLTLKGKEIDSSEGKKIIELSKNKLNLIKQLNTTVAKGGSKGKAAAQVLAILTGTTVGASASDPSAGTSSMVKNAAIGGGAVATLGTKTGRKVLSNLLSAAGVPLSVGFNVIYGIDPESSLDRTILGAEAALAPMVVKDAIRVTDKIKNPLLKKVAQVATTINPKYALKAAKVLNPIGIASLAGEAVYNVGKLGYEDQKRFNALSPEEQAAERAEQEKFAFDVEGS